MSEVERIADQLERTYRNWWGESVMEKLQPVTAAQANNRPLPFTHNMIEIVLHMAFWLEAMYRRLENEVIQPTDADEWPEPAPGEAGWKQALDRLDSAHRRLVAEVKTLSDSDLVRVPPECVSNLYVLLHWAGQHLIYHAGQIGLLKKALAQGEQV